MVDIFLSILVLGGVVCNFFLGWLVYKKDRKNPTNRIFSVFAGFCAIWGIGLFLYQHPIFFPSIIWLKIVYLTVLFMVGLLFLFSFSFPEFKSRFYVWAMIGYFILAVFFAYTIVFTRLFVFDVVPASWGPNQVLGPAYLYFGIFSAVVASWSVINFFRRYKKAKGLVRAQFRFVFFGIYFFCLIPVTLDIIFPLLLKDSRFIWFSPIGATMLVGFIGYSIVRHRLLDIRFWALRLATYSLLVAALAVFYASIIVIFSQLLFPQYFRDHYLLFTTLTASFVAFSFQPLRRYFEKISDKILYKNRYEPEELLKTLSRAITSTIDIDLIGQKLVDTLRLEMKISKVFFISFNRAPFVVEAASGEEDLVLDNEILSLFKKEKDLLVMVEMEPGEIKKFLSGQGISIAIPLRAEGRLVGYLFLGEKVSGDIYFDRDIETLEILAPQVAIAIQNANSYGKIKRFNLTLKKEVNKATRKLKKANLRLKELSVLKDEFVSIASHQLRTPMTAIKGYIWLVLDRNKNLDSKTKQNLNRAYESVERTILLVRDMLTVSRIEGKRLDIVPTKVDLVKVSKEIAEEMTFKAKEKKIEIEVAEPRGSLYIKVDPDKIRDVILNLVDNAVKFSPERGKVIISFGNAKGIAIFHVTDNGPGIAKSDRDKLFKKFSRIEKSFSQLAQVPGTGLGLYIAKQIISLHKGRIWVKSEVGKGTTFSFSLPRAK